MGEKERMLGTSDGGPSHGAMSGAGILLGCVASGLELGSHWRVRKME